jgi:RNA polymerase-binding protein DksA
VHPIAATRLRDRLLSQRREILAAYESHRAPCTTCPAADSLDAAAARTLDQLVVNLRHSERGLLRRIDAALARIEAGQAGDCTCCGAPIGAPRLDAVPWAETCIRCQLTHEEGVA